MNELLVKQAQTILEDENLLSGLCNLTALLYDQLDNLNWVGYYYLKDGVLYLGPFQGKVACSKIIVPNGVCGTCVNENRIIRVDDVHKFKGHIACDSASNSEIVLPLYKDKELVGLLDIDSPILNRFSDDDEETLSKIADQISNQLKRHL